MATLALARARARTKLPSFRSGSLAAAGEGDEEARIAMAGRYKGLANREKNARGQVEAIDGDLEALPAVGETDRFEAWRTEAAGGPKREHVVVCVWPDPVPNAPLLEVDADAWRQRFEAPYLLWNFALGAASRRCGDGGAIVAVVQAPEPLGIFDCWKTKAREKMTKITQIRIVSMLSRR